MVDVSLKGIARRVLGSKYNAVAENVSHRRLEGLERRLADLERRSRQDVHAKIARLLYHGLGQPTTDSLAQHELQICSQNGEDGILLLLLSLTSSPTRRLAEIGIGDGSECNSANLLINWGWSGTLVEGDVDGSSRAAQLHRGRNVSVLNEFVTVENINALLPTDPIDLLSIDIDGNDYWVWQATAADPLVTVIEYNASLGPTRSATIPYDPHFDYTTASPHRLYHGASLRALARLGVEKGMALVGCDSQGVNAFFVQRRFIDEGRLAEVDSVDAWRPIQKRLRQWSHEEQERMLRGFEFVDV